MNIKLLPENMSRHLSDRMEMLDNSLSGEGLSLPEDSPYINELEKVMFFSEFAASSFIREPGMLIDLIGSGDLEAPYPEGEYARRVTEEIQNAADASDLRAILLSLRMREMVRIAWLDLVERVSLDQTLKDLSDLAEACVDKAITFIYDKLCSTSGTPIDSNGNVQKIIVLGMGKLGAGELNFSSDIDLIFAYPEDTTFVSTSRVDNGTSDSDLTAGRVQFNTTGEFFTKLCREFLKVFDSSMSGSMLFRVDTRLRPFGENGPLAMSFYTMEEYYQTQGREWERYALIKARPIAGDLAAGYRLLKLLNPFVYRRYFDYGTFDALRDMKKRISLQVRDRRFRNNIKLGAGGIREIEFFGQIFQLIRGGVEPEFQEPRILKVLDLLVGRKCIEPVTGEELDSAYRFLRKVEHRLQEYEDRQTHDLPENRDAMIRLALSMESDLLSDSSGSSSEFGSECEDGCDECSMKLEMFNRTLNGHMTRVHGHFSSLLDPDMDEKGDEENDALKYIWHNINDPQFDSASCKVPGFEDSARIVDLLKSVAEHQNTKKLTTNGRKRLDRLIPLLIHKVGEEVNCPAGVTGNGSYNGVVSTSENGVKPEVVLQRLIDLVLTIERRTCYLSLLIEKAQALDNLVNLAYRSPWIISFLSLHPVLLDELLAPSTLYTPPDRAEMERELDRRMAHSDRDEFEFQLQELCIFKQVMILRIDAADLSGNYPLMKVSDRLTELAETVLNKVIEISWYNTVRKYGTPSCMGESTGDKFDQSILSFDSSYSGRKGDSPAISPGFAAIAYGKLGGIELGYKSDLDMVFVHSAGEGQTEGGSRSIENMLFYTFLGQRIISALTLHTQAGKLYEADMRLRPNGQSGMIVSHIDAFQDYIQNEAWTWEHQAIIRARPIGGDPALQNRFNTVRNEILSRKRDPHTLKEEVRTMRERMRKEHLKPEPLLFDLKQGRGGVVDIEFLVQYLVLQNASEHPALTRWTDNVRLLETLANENILTSERAELLKRGYLKLRRMIHHLNLQEREKRIPMDTFREEGEAIAAIFDGFLYE